MAKGEAMMAKTSPTQRTKAPLEKDITNGIRDVLESLNIFHWKQWQGPMSAPKGVADILGIYKTTEIIKCPHCKNNLEHAYGKPLAIEVKTQTGELSEHQKEFLQRWKDEGGLALVARSADEVIDDLGLRHKFS